MILPEVDSTLHWVLAGGLSLLLVSSSAQKIRDQGAFRAAIAGYDLVPPAISSIVAAALTAAELLIGCALLVPRLGGAAALCAAVLLAVYTGAVGLALGLGRRDIDCGCGGPSSRLPLRPSLLLRNACLIATALAASLPVSARPLVWIDAVTVIGAVAFAALLYAAGETAIANAVWDSGALRAARSEVTARSIR